MKLDAGMLGHLAGLYQKNTDIRFTGLGAVFLGRTMALARRLSHLNLKLWRFHGIYHFLVDFVIGISAALCLVILYATSGAGPLPVGTFLLFMYYTVLIFPNLSQIGEAWPMINDARAALARIEANTGHIRARSAREGARPAPAPGDIVFEDVSLAGDRGEPILEHVSFTIPAGARFGLCGDSGTGKTTIILATLGLLTPVTGRVTIGGRDARDFTLAERKRLFCYARAQPAFIAGRVDENIALNREAGDERMARALDDTRLAARLAREPAGMRAPIGEKGEPFSGGEQQRIAMARVLMGEQPCLILDEALNSLDEASEVAITERLIAGLAGRTLIVVSHRRGLWPMFPHRLELTRGAPPRIVTA
jgi:ABC-type multidrug transport system fused ATPase/permease subunit